MWRALAITFVVALATAARAEGPAEGDLSPQGSRPRSDDVAGLMAEISGDPDEAIKFYTRELNGPDADGVRSNIYRHLHDAFRFKGDYDRAITAIDAAIRAMPRHYRAYDKRCRTYQDSGDFEKAIADCTTAIELLKPFEHALIGAVYDNRGNAYRARGDYDKAIADYDAGLLINLDPILGYADRGYADLAAGRFGAAAADFAKSLAAPLDANKVIGIPYEGDRDRSQTRFKAVLGLHLARVRAGEDDAPEFGQNAATVSKFQKWPSILVAFYLRQSTRQEVVSAAESRSEPIQRRQLCEANFFLGESALINHDSDAAESFFTKAHSTCAGSTAAYAVATVELKRLRK
jgi:tetratricopeptide (TPR) repeat protein